jgi:acetyl-CoA C-acetyltransferase
VRDVFLIGARQTSVRRDGDDDLDALGVEAIGGALLDSGIDADRVDALYVGNMTSGMLSSQQQLGGLLADYSGLAGREALTIEAACASGSAAARMAYMAIAGGMLDVVVVCGVERLAHVDRDSATTALATAADRQLESSQGESFLSLNALLMRDYMDKYRVAAEDFAPFSITAHRNAMTNPFALFHKPLDVECYMESRIVESPLRLFDISPICDGAAAVVLASADAIPKPNGRSVPRVRVAASSIATAPVALQRREDPLHLAAVEASTMQALRQAGITHKDLDLLELHDAYTIMTVLSLEAAGFAEPGTGTRLGREGRIARGGDLPISTLGGLKARGHPVGATGVYQLVEAHAQLCGRAGENQVPGARNALVQNIGGTASTVVSHVLQRID